METHNHDGEKTVATAITLDILNSKIKIPPMPALGTQIMDMARLPTDQIDIARFCKLIEPDPGLYARVLQLANSSYYKGIDEIVSLRSAVTRIGLSETVNSVNLYFLQEFLPDLGGLKGFSANDFWAFTWACAVSARYLGHPEIAGDSLPGELYIAGLLQGVGQLMLAIHHPDRFFNCIQRAEKANCPLDKIFVEEFETTDNLIAAKLMSAWNLPERICKAVEFCHDPSAATDDFKEIAGLTQLARCIALSSDIGGNLYSGGMKPESAWICRQAWSPLTNPKILDRSVKEALSLLAEKVESVTGTKSAKPAGDNEIFPEKVSSPKKSNKRPVQKDAPKKGIGAWFKSWFS